MSLLDAAGVVTGDIWCSGAFSFESPLKDLLDSGEYTLEQLLAEDELLQELRGVHPQLIEFLSTPQAVTGLIRYVILPPDAPMAPISASSTAAEVEIAAARSIASQPSEATEKTEGKKTEEENGNEIEEKKEISEKPSAEEKKEAKDKLDEIFVRYPYMACEVICCEIKGIIDTLVDDFVPDESTESAALAPSRSEEASAEDEEPSDEDSETPKDPRPQTILDLLFSLLYESNPGEIDDYRAGYFDKILSVLFRKRPQALGQYINEGGGKGSDVLMKAMFKHLYSHSIMQIAQRLLLPQPPLPPRDENEEENPDNELYSDPLEGQDLDGFGSFRCNWSESPVALKLLLDCLIKKSPYPEIEGDEEKRLSMYRNASEVLITIIQNSPLTSPTLHALTTDPILQKLVVSACTLEDGDSFSPHDSRLTCTMNVLESLILQLGGYGSVGTVMFPEDEENEEAEEEDADKHENNDNSPGGGREQNVETDREGAGEPSSSSGVGQEAGQELATSDTLISHLSMMLSALCDLLRYEGADNWVSPMQFSKTKPQKILGSSRLRIVRLLESLVLLGDPNVDTLLCQSNCLEVCLDLFWNFQWCSMLHQSVANLLVHVFEGANARAELQSYFLVRCNLLGRLMDSFWEDSGRPGMVPSGSGSRLSEAVMAMKKENEGITSSVQSEVGSTRSVDVLPVSDDDVDAALEQQQEARASDSDGALGESMAADGFQLPEQSFRLGYMGHVIIICQALVHASSSDMEDPSVGGTSLGEEQPEMMNGELGDYMDKRNPQRQENSPEERIARQNSLERESVVTDETPANPLILAQLVETHPLRNRWQDFVSTTLASETAIQSTPLGGFNGAPGGMDPLHSHRPGLAEDDDYDGDDGAAPPLPPRGLLVGGDVIDMDDNDLDVAASMMAGLSLGRGAGDGARTHQDLLAGIPSQGGPASYGFDDPLGSNRFGQFGDEDSNSSSDEESELSGNTGDSGGAVNEGYTPDVAHNETTEAPVMDLFAGNFEAFDDQPQSDDKGSNWSDFANFDDAFAGSDTIQDSGLASSSKSDSQLEDVFKDVKDHASLLEDIPNEPSPERRKTSPKNESDDDQSPEKLASFSIEDCTSPTKEEDASPPSESTSPPRKGSPPKKGPSSPEEKDPPSDKQ